MEDHYPEADLQLHSDPVPPPQGKGILDDPTSGAQRDAHGKTLKKRKRDSSLPSHVKRNVVREAAAVRVATAEDTAQCVVSGASDQRAVIEFCHVVSDKTPSSEVSDIFPWSRSNADGLQMDRLEWSWRRKYLSLNVDTRKNIQIREWPYVIYSNIHVCWYPFQSALTSNICSARRKITSPPAGSGSPPTIILLSSITCTSSTLVINLSRLRRGRLQIRSVTPKL